MKGGRSVEETIELKKKGLEEERFFRIKKGIK